jgi:hypothetical protein
VSWSNSFSMNALPAGSLPPPHGLGGVAGHEQRPQPGSQRLDAPRELGARHVRHDHVGYEDVDRLVTRGRALERGERSVGRQDAVAVRGEHVLDQPPDALLVLAQQDRLGAGQRFGLRGGPGRLGRGGRVGGGQVDLEARAEVGLGVDVHAPARLRDDPVHGGQPEAGALADLLGREERLEHVLDGLAAHADAGVGDR